MFLTIGSDNLTNIFGYLVDTQDIINVAKVCRLFNLAIWISIQMIQTCHKKNVPSTWIIKFPRLHTIIPNVIINSDDDLMLLAKQLITASFYLYGKSVFQRASDFIKEQKKHHVRRFFTFNGLRDIVVAQDSVFYFGQEGNLLTDLTTHLQTRSLAASIFLDPLPSCIQEFTYIVGVRYPGGGPSLNSYLDRERFAVYPYNKSSRCFDNYRQFGDNFRHYFQHRQYPYLRQLDVGMTLADYDYFKKEGCFPHLDLISLSVTNRSEEGLLYKYLLDNHHEIPKMVIIYTDRIGRQRRINEWIIGDLQIKACNLSTSKKVSLT